MTESSHERTARGARLVGAGIIVSRVLGLVRGYVFSYFFGTGDEADAYTAASKIPNALRNLLGEGAISASFIPVYSAALARGDERGAKALANALLGVLIGVVALLTLIGITAAPALTAFLAFGFESVPGKMELTTRLMRVLFPMTGLMVLSGWCLGIQNAHRRFFIAYASGAMWSIAQIALLLVAGPGESDLVHLVWLLSWATLVGAALQIAVQLPQVIRLTGGIRPSLATRSEGLRTTLMNFIPVVGALGIFQVSSFVDQQIASILPTGAASSLQAASNIYLLPLSLFGIATAAAALPQMARDHALGQTTALGEGISRAFAGVLFYTIPSAVAFVAIGDCLVTLLNGGGQFGPDEIRVVRTVLAAYGLGLVSYACARVLAATFQATGNYRQPFRSAVWAIVVSATVSVTFALTFTESRFAVAGLALGAAFGAQVNFLLLWRSARTKIGRIETAEPLRIAGRTLGVALIAAVAAVGVKYGMPRLPSKVLSLLVIATYCVVFLAAARQAGLAEATRLMNSVVRRART